jgi:electron transfer flavoprotein alpha subunit
MYSRCIRSAIGLKISHVAGYSARRFGSTLVFADFENNKLNDSTLNVLSAAKQLGHPVTVLVAGFNCNDVAKEVAVVNGVSNVLVANDASLEHNSAESISDLMEEIQKKNNFSHVVASGRSVNKNWVPRFAAKADVQPISEVISIKSPDTFVRPMYAGNAISVVQSSDPIKLLTVRTTCFEKQSPGASAAPIQTISFTSNHNRKAEWVSDTLTKSDRPELTAAPIVISGGRGMKSGENFKMLEELADLCGGAVGASRAAVDAGFVPNDLQIGQTGKVVAPSLYVAVGVSGAIQHLAGMKDSKTIVAINKDPEAPIFQVADYGLVADLFTAVPELTSQVKANKK